MSDVQARAAEKVEVALRSVGIRPERWVSAKIAAVLAEAGLLSEHRVNGLATWRELCEKAEDERDAARAELAKVQLAKDELRGEIKRLAARLQIEKPEAERRGAVAALREAADAVDVHKSAYFIRGWLQGRAALIEGEDRG